MDPVPNTQASDGVSLGPVPALEDNQVTLGLSNPTPVSDDVATVRAAKMNEGLKGLIPQQSADEIKQEILAGREQQMRNIAASNLNVQTQKNKLNLLTQMATQKGAPLDENEVQRVMDPFNPNNKPIDPNSVSEAQYAVKYVSSIQDAIDAVPNNPVGEAQQEIPDQADAIKRTGSIITAKMEYANKVMEDKAGQFTGQSLVSKGWDIAKSMFQPYNEYEMRGNVPGVGGISGGLLLGTNMQEQADKIVAIPDFDEYTKAVDNAVSNLTPVMAMRFLDYIKGLPATDKYLDNAFTLLAPADYAAIGKGAIGIAKRIDMYNRTNIAVRTLVQNADKVGVDAAKRAEVTGNLDGAATERSTENVLQNMQGSGDPMKVATDDTLLTFMNQDKAKIAASPGNLSGQQVTRIQDQFDASGQTLIQRILDAARINRTPMALATRNAVNIVRDSVKDYYSGIRNAILDVSDPLYEPKSNTYWFETTIGNHDGTLFSNDKTAQNFAKQYGMEDAKIIQGNGPVTNTQTQRLLDQRVQLQKNISDAETSIQNNKNIYNDKTATDAQRQVAREQFQGLAQDKKGFEKILDETNLRLEGEAKYNRVSDLQDKISQAQSYNKTANDHLVKGRPPLTAEDRQILKDAIEANNQRISGHREELRAINSGRASVIGSNATTVQQHGVGFKIVVRRPLVETDRAVRDLLIRDPSGNLIPDATSTGSQTGLKSLMNWGIGRFRGADDTLSLNESIQRKVGTYTQSLFKEWANQEAKYIKQLASGVIRKDPVTGADIPYWKAKPTALWNTITRTRHQQYNEFARTLDFARGALDPVTAKPGYFFETPGELQDHYQRFYNRDPSYAEHEGYFAFKRMVEGDRIMRELSEFRNRARLGVEQFQLKMRGKDGQQALSGFFDARAKKEFPGGDDVMMIMGKRAGEEKVVNLGGAGLHPKQIEEYREGVRTGRYRVIEIYAPEYKPLRDFSDVAGNEHVRYVLTEAADSKPIEFNHVNRRGGGHFEYDYDHFLKQASMYHQYEHENGVRGKYRSVYVGDTTFMPLLNRVMGRDIASKLHEVQRLLRTGDIEGAKNFTQANLPIEFDKLHGMFKPGRDGNGKPTSPQLDLHEPFVVVPNGRSVLDMDKGLERRYGTSFKDSAKSGSLNKQFQVAYNTERESYGITHLEDVGTQGSPLYKYAPSANMVDPITTMNRALNRIVNTTFMDDYKMYAVEHWLREAETYLKADESEIRAAPFWHFQNAESTSAFKSGMVKEHPDVISNLLSNRFKIQQFVGIPNKAQTAIQTAKQYLVDTFYQKFGPEGSRTVAQKAITLVPLWALNHATDPITFLRSMTFHEKLGLFNPAQLLVQAQTFATILSVSPFHGVSGTYASLLHQWYRINPGMIETLDRMATKMGVFGQSRWRPGEFKESIETLNKTGFDRVAGEYANLNTALKTDFIGNDFKNFLNAGTIFFKEGERSQRLGGWHTAFREFREANPTGSITKSDIGKILQRADLLTVNMSRASNSMLHQGIFSLPTQFLTYQLRLAELFMGTRLGGTTMERTMARLRLITFYSALYGAPSAVGLTGLPLADSIRKEAIQRGYTIGDNWLKTAVMEGLPAIAMHFVTGGNNYNIGQRYGSPGFTQLQDALKSNAPWWQLLGGASGTTMLNQLTSQSNFWHAMGSMAFRPNTEKPFPLRLDDFVDMFKEISSVNQAWKLYAAINTGKWMSKNEAYVGDVTKSNALFMAMTGLSPQEQGDAFLKSGIRSDEVEYQKYLLKRFIEEQQRGYQAATDNNPSAASAYHRRAQTILEIGGYPHDKIGTAYSIATKGWESQIKDEDYSFAFKNVPQSRSDFMGIPMPFTTQSDIPDTRREQFRTQQRLNNMQGQ